MMTTYLFYLAFTSFIVVMLIMGLFFITSMSINYIFKALVDRKVKDNKEIIQNHFSNPKDVSDEEMGQVRKLISSKVGLLGFYRIYKDYISAHGFNEDIRWYSNRVIEFKMLINNKIVRSKYRKSYILFLMSEFRLDSKKVIEYAMNALDNDSIYTRYNALKLIRNSGNTSCFLESLEIIKLNDKRFNVRVLVDFMDQFKGNMILLNKKLASNLNSYSNKIKKAVIFHFTNCHYGYPEARDALLYYLANETDKGLLIAAIRYFEKIIDESAEEHLSSNLFNKDWEIRAASAKILEQYPSDKVTADLEKALRDDNYFVRLNSAASLSRMVHDEKLIKAILSKTDKFGEDSLLYAMYFENNMMEKDDLDSNVKEVV